MGKGQQIYNIRTQVALNNAASLRQETLLCCDVAPTELWSYKIIRSIKANLSPLSLPSRGLSRTVESVLKKIYDYSSWG